MAEIALLTSVLALILGVVLLFGFTRLFAEVASISNYVYTDQLEHGHEELIADSPTLALAVESHCLACVERLDELAATTSRRAVNRPMIILTHTENPDAINIPGARVIRDSALMSRCGVNTTPQTLLFDEKGVITRRRIVGDTASFREEIERFQNGVATESRQNVDS